MRLFSPAFITVAVVAACAAIAPAQTVTPDEAKAIAEDARTPRGPSSPRRPTLPPSTPAVSRPPAGPSWCEIGCTADTG